MHALSPYHCGEFGQEETPDSFALNAGGNVISPPPRRPLLWSIFRDRFSKAKLIYSFNCHLKPGSRLAETSDVGSCGPAVKLRDLDPPSGRMSARSWRRRRCSGAGGLKCRPTAGEAGASAFSQCDKQDRTVTAICRQERKDAQTCSEWIRADRG